MKWIKRIGYVLATLLLLLAVAVGAIYAASSRRLNKTFAVTPKPVAVPADSATLMRGRHLAVAIAKCAGCHGDDLGGRAVIDNGAFGRVYAPNITRGTGGIGSAMASDADWVRAIRHGVAPGGHALFIMPSFEYSAMADEDLGALIAYVKTVPLVNRANLPTAVKLLPRALMVFGQFPGPAAERIDHDATRPKAIPADTSGAYGNYLVTIGACTVCHNTSLSGHPPNEPGAPPSPNLTPGGNIGKWSYTQFVQTLRTGTRPDGSKLNPLMPWPLAGQMTDEEMTAVWNYLRSLPAREFNQ